MSDEFVRRADVLAYRSGLKYNLSGAICASSLIRTILRFGAFPEATVSNVFGHLDAQMKIARKKVVYVLPLQTPYNTPRLAVLARHPELEIVVLLEADQFPGRPGWAASAIPGCRVEVLGSQLSVEHIAHPDLAYEITGVRHVPWRLPFALLRHRPDIVVLCNATELIFALAAKLFSGFKIVLNVEDTLHSVRHVPALRARIKCWMYRHADLHLAFSRHAEEYLKSIGIVTSVARTSWSVDVNSFEPDVTKREIIRNQLSLPHKVVFLFVGRLVPLKGLMPLLRAWSGLDAYTRARSALLIVGVGPLECEAKRFVDDRNLTEVQFVGQVPYDEMPAYYSAADLLILPTLQDVWGLAVLEAMASARAVMTTRYCGASYLVREGVNGWLFDPADEVAIQTQIANAIRVRSELPVMGAAARAGVQRLNTADVMNDVAEILKGL